MNDMTKKEKAIAYAKMIGSLILFFGCLILFA